MAFSFINIYLSQEKDLTENNGTDPINEPDELAKINYRAEYHHQGSKENININGDVFTYLPIPNINNDSIIETEEDKKYLENTEWKLIRIIEENKYKVQAKNNISDSRNLIEPREHIRTSNNAIKENTELGPKIFFQIIGTDLVENGSAIYENEILVIESEILVEKDKLDKISLEDKKEKINAAIYGTNHSNEFEYVPLKYDIYCSLKIQYENEKIINNYQFETDNYIPSHTWVELKKEPY